MAPGMKLWLAAVGIGLTSVAVALLPPEAYRTDGVAALPEEEAQFAIHAEIRRLHGTVQAMRWSDSLAALTLASAQDGLATGVYVDAFRAERVDAWRADLAAQLAALEPRDPRMTIGVYVQPAAHAALSGIPIPAMGELQQIYVGEREGAPYCIVVQPVRGTPSRLSLDDVGLGTCRWLAKYGMPGPRMLDWLEDGAMTFGEWGPTPPERVVFSQGGQRIVLEDSWPFPPDYSVFGSIRHPLMYGDLNVSVDRCAAGQAPACLESVTDAEAIANTGLDAPYIVARSPVSHIEARYQAPPFGPLSRTLLANMEADFGEAAFAEFWTSRSSVPDAFQSSFATDMGTWVRDWVGERFGTYRAGPSPRASTLLLSVLTLMVLSAAACVTHWRRRVA